MSLVPSLQENSSIATEKLQRPFSLIICYDYCNIFAIKNIRYSFITNLLQNNNYNRRCIFSLLNCNILQHKKNILQILQETFNIQHFKIIANLQKKKIKKYVAKNVTVIIFFIICFFIKRN